MDREIVGETDGLADHIEARIAAALRRERDAHGWSLAALAERSGVSKAMLSKIELGQSSPTAGLLGRVCAGLGITMSTLMARVEQGDAGVVRSAEQPVWTDPESGLTRRLLMGRRAGSELELAEVTLPRRTVVDYPVAPSHGPAQHLVMRSGRLRWTYGAEVFDLQTGDVLFAVIDRPTRFETFADPARYLLVQDAGR